RRLHRHRSVPAPVRRPSGLQERLLSEQRRRLRPLPGCPRVPLLRRLRERLRRLRRVRTKLLVDGRGVGPEAGGVRDVEGRAPYEDGLVGTACEGGWAQMDEAIEAAARAFPSWRDSPCQERRELLARIV